MTINMGLSDLIVRYIGYGEYAIPRCAWDGIPVSDDQRTQVGEIAAEVVNYDVNWANKTLGDGAEEAVRAVSSEHPYLSGSALNALKWLFAYEWK